MGARFAKEYVTEVFAARDFDRVYYLISLVDHEANLPEEFWLFSRVFEWAPPRSGVRQYYEALPQEKFLRIKSGLEQYGFHEIATKYSEGHRTWNSLTSAATLEHWLDENSDDIHAVLLQLIKPKIDYLVGGS